MFNRIIFILTSIYFLAGTVLLPQGDFSALSQLKGMYHHCKTIEDPDIDLADFVTEHLLNLDDMGEEEDDADEHELPHNPMPFHTTTTGIFYYANEPERIPFNTTQTVVQDKAGYHSPYFSRLNTHRIFQPPRV
jgi:hypothetical protein